MNEIDDYHHYGVILKTLIIVLTLNCKKKNPFTKNLQKIPYKVQNEHFSLFKIAKGCFNTYRYLFFSFVFEF